MIGGALAGAFFGVLVTYGLFAPKAKSQRSIYGAEAKHFIFPTPGFWHTSPIALRSSRLNLPARP
jgi:hypothetical protein